ncbi:MAG: molybdopterin-dependent oxidoreductase [Solirubrobacterales bacterium]
MATAETRVRALDGALAATSGLVAGELVAGALPMARSPLTGTGKLMIDLTSPLAVDMTVATAEHLDKPILRGALVAQLIGLGAAAGARLSPRPVGAVVAGAGIATGIAAATRSESSTLPSLMAGAAAAAGGAGAHALVGRGAGRRARIVLGAATAAGALAALALASRKRRVLTGKRDLVDLGDRPFPRDSIPADASFEIPGLSPLFTPPGDFYTTDTQLPAPAIDPDEWRLRVTGMVEEPLELSFDDLLALDPVELDATLVCVHNPVGGPRIDSARWLGVPIARLLEESKPLPGASQLLARSVDGYTSGVPLPWIEAGSTAILAIGMAGEPLPTVNGFPARLLIPGLWGADANTKWVTELELTTWEAIRDYWDRRGWPRTPTSVRPGSRIDVPANRALVVGEPVRAAGVAWAPPSGVEGVEVSIDGGEWQAAELSRELAPTMWRQWRLELVPEPGEHRMRVRAIGRARPQSGEWEPPYPTGSSGFHEVHFEVLDSEPSLLRRVHALAGAAGDDLGRRMRLARAAVGAWRERGYPPSPRFPPPQSHGYLRKGVE